MVNEAHDLILKLREAMKDEVRSYLKVGAVLYELKKDKKYRMVGEHIETIEDLFTEEGLGRAQGYNYIKVYERFKAYQSNMLDIPQRRLLDIIHAKVDNEQIPDLLESAKTMTYTDFKDELRVKQGKISALECNHDGDMIQWEQCDKCKKFFKI